MTRCEPRVFLIGAGPGHPELLTLRAVECLAKADLVIHDKLVPPAIVDHAPAAARIVCVTALAQCHGQSSTAIVQTMIDAARRGQTVVRLKGGDPYIFGRGGEEAEALAAAGIPFEVIPGITAALGAAAFAGIPLTHRAHASYVVLATGHENPAKAETHVEWDRLAQLSGTLVIYMAVAQLPLIVERLLKGGKPADTPAAAVQWATLGEQRTVTARLADLPAAVVSQGLTAPAIVVIGSVVQLHERLAWFEQKPLFGKRVLVTRPQQQAPELVRRLRDLGACVSTLPAVAIAAPADWTPVDAALARMQDYRWLVFTSSNGVHALMKRMQTIGFDSRLLGNVKIAVIGPSTADTLRKYYLNPDLMPAEYCSESLAAALGPLAVGARVLLARADRGRDLLREELAKVCSVDQIAVYAQVDAIAEDAGAFDLVRRGEIDFVTLTSSNIARSFLSRLDETCRARIQAGIVQLVSISPVTSAAIEAMGMPVAAEAKVYTSAGVVAALWELANVAVSVPRQVKQDAGANQTNVVDGLADAAIRNVEGDVQD